MSRSRSVLCLLFALMALLATSGSFLVAEQNGGYAIGPLTAIGLGTPDVAQAEATREMWAIVESVKAKLPPGDTFSSVHIERQSYDAPVHTLTFSIVVVRNGGPAQ